MEKQMEGAALVNALGEFEVMELEEHRLRDVRGGVPPSCGDNCECNSTIGCGPDVNIPC